MKRITICLAIMVVSLSGTSTGQSKAKASQMPYAGAPCTGTGGIKASPEQTTKFNRFDVELRSAIKRNDPTEMSFLVNFPLRVNTNKGTLLIPDAASLSGHYEEIFSLQVRELILATGLDDYSCRYDEGLSYKNGVIWVSTDDHKFGLDSVNMADLYSKPEKPTLIYACETKTHRIAIDRGVNGEFRYRSWNKPKMLSLTPDVDLSLGKQSFEGTGICTTATYTFKAGHTQYEVSDGLGCTDGSEPAKATGRLQVSIEDKQITDTWCY